MRNIHCLLETVAVHQRICQTKRKYFLNGLVGSKYLFELHNDNILGFSCSYTRKVLDETLRTAVVAPWAARVYEYDLPVGKYTIPAEVRSYLITYTPSM